MTKVGVLIDFPWAYPDSVRRTCEDSLRLAFDEALEDGVLDRPVEVVYRLADGLPKGDAFEVLKAWRWLAEDQGCVAILGPISSENALAVREHVEALGRVPSITWGGTEHWNGRWCFSLGQGSLCDEPFLMANFLAHSGVRRVATVADRSAIGDDYVRFFKDACAFEGIEIVHSEVVGQLETSLDETTDRLRQQEPEGVAYFGFGLTAVRLAEAFTAIGWDPLRVMSAGFLTAPLLPGGWQVLRGWHGIDLYDHSNAVGQDFLDRFDKRFGYRPENYFAVNAYDTGQLLAQGIGRARPLSTGGVRDGLEAVKMLPAASGGSGTMLGFGPYAHRGWLGQDYLVISRVQDGFRDEGLMASASTELVHTMQPRPRSVRRPGPGRS